MTHRPLVQSLLATIVALVLFLNGTGVIGGGSTAIATPQDGSDTPTTAKFVPKAAPMMVSLRGTSNPLSGLLAGNDPLPSAQTPATQLLRLPQTLLASADIDYQTDIQPWVTGELTFALADPAQDPTPGYLFAVMTRNAKDSQALLDHLWQQQVAAGQPLWFEQYQGISLITTDLPLSDPSRTPIASAPFNSVFQSFKTLATAVFEDRYVLITNGSQVLHRIIDAVQSPEQSLTQFADYQQVVNTLQQSQPWGFAFINLSTLLPPSSQEKLPLARPYRSAALTLSSQRNGILAETVLVADPEQPGPSVEPTVTKSIQALNYIPANSPFVVAGIDLGQWWSQINHDLTANERAKQWVTQLVSQGKHRWGIDFPHAIFPFVEGDYSVAMLPPNPVLDSTKSHPPNSAEWLFVNAVPNTTAESALAQQLQELAQQYQVGVSPFTLDGKSVSAWTRIVDKPQQSAGPTVLSAQVEGAFTTVKDHRIVATSLGALKQSLTAQNQPLAQQQDFQEAIAPFKLPNQGYIYLDWPQMRPLLEQQLPQLKTLEQTAPSLFQRLRSLSISTYGETPQAQRSQIFFQLADS